MVPTSAEMASAIQNVATKLLQCGVLDQLSSPNLNRVVALLRKGGGSKAWNYTVERETGLTFTACQDNNNSNYHPVVSVAGIAVSEAEGNVSPFLSLDLSLELRYVRNPELTFRWHFDKANEKEAKPKTGGDRLMQPGPFYHLQFGGRIRSGDRASDMPVSVPRWSHPPMDLVLLLEAVTANFFPEQWNTLRDDLAWCNHIQLAQKLCLKPYSDRLKDHLNTSRGTVLSHFWADRWTA